MIASRPFLLAVCAVLFSASAQANPSASAKPSALEKPSASAKQSSSKKTSGSAKPSDYDKHKAQYFASKAEQLSKEQRYEEAAVCMESALKFNPANARFHARRSDFFYLSQDDDEEALKEIDLALSLDKTNPVEYLSKKAAILERLRRCPEALSLANKVLADRVSAIASKSSADERKLIGFYYGQRAGIHKSMNHLQEAENDLTQALKFDPNASDLHIHRAQISSQLKHWSSAVADAGFVIGADHRGSPVLRKREAYLILAGAYVGLKDFAKATSTYLTALKECRDDRLVLSEAQKYFASMGDKKTAADLKKRLDSLDEDFVPFK